MMILILVLVILVALWVAVSYNRLVSLVNKTGEAWSDIDVQLKRRYDLIPNLVETVKSYASHESQTLEKVTEARTAAMGAQTPEARGQAEASLAGALKSVFALAESYPDLKANQGFLDLQAQLSETENNIQASRRYYNGNVRDLNTTIQAFPSNIIAGLFHFATKEFFQLDSDAEKQPVAVKF